eukprot:gene35278-47407_t
MIRKLKDGKYRLYSRKKDEKTGKRRNLGTFDNREAAEKHEREMPMMRSHAPEMRKANKTIVPRAAMRALRRAPRLRTATRGPPAPYPRLAGGSRAGA